MRGLLPVCLLALLPTTVFAQSCPDAATAKTGFVLGKQGTTARVRRANDLLTHVVNTYPGGTKQDVLYFRGLFEICRSSENGRRIAVPLTDLRTVFPLKVGVRRAVTYIPAQPDGAGAPVSLELSVESQEKLQVGSCSYEVLVVRNRFLGPDGRVMSQHVDFYSPDLGFVLAKKYDEGGGRESLVKYQSIGSF
jgi:hypothetical protein